MFEDLMAALRAADIDDVLVIGGNRRGVEEVVQRIDDFAAA